MFYFHPYLGKIPILTNIFEMGWNHQPVVCFSVTGILIWKKHSKTFWPVATPQMCENVLYIG